MIEDRISRLRPLTYEQAAALPTVFAQPMSALTPDSVLVTVQVARSGFLGIASYHTERGLVFVRGHAARDATDLELQENGG